MNTRSLRRVWAVITRRSSNTCAPRRTLIRLRPAVLLGVLASACGGDDNDGTGPTVPRIDGTPWEFEAEYGNSAQGVACTLNGTISFTQSDGTLTGGQITGEEVCVVPGGPINLEIDQPIASGQVTQAGLVTFSTSDEGVTCEVEGQFAEDNLGQAIEGTMQCSGGDPSTLTGTFSAQR